MRVEVTHISEHGFWLLLPEGEAFVSFKAFPWFREAPVGHIHNVELLHDTHLYWPDLDIDLAVDSIAHPDRYPLVSKVRSTKELQRPAGVGRVADKPRSQRRAGRR